MDAKKYVFGILEAIQEGIDPSENGRRVKYISDFINQQETYAELGRLVVESPGGICHNIHYGEKWSACRQCRKFKACQKRAELLAAGRE